MERLERFQQMHRVLRAGKCLPMSHFLQGFEVSKATFKRDIEYMRDRIGAPIEYDAARRGYCYTDDPKDPGRFELPGLWFNGAEVEALLVMDAMLRDIGGGLLDEHIKPLMQRLTELLDVNQFKPNEIRSRIRILHQAARRTEPTQFSVIAQAVLARQRLRITHINRGTNQTTEREISPQRLVHYRDNWYVDAWCHFRQGLRSFALDAISAATHPDKKAKDVPEEKLNRFFQTSYGIFSGEPTATAVLKFTPERARWVVNESWHPEQVSLTEEDGSLVLDIPYSDPRELVMDILRHGAAVEVIAPQSLREMVQAELHGALSRYAKGR